MEVPHADGLVFDGRRLWVVQNSSNKIARYTLSGDLGHGVKEKEITSPAFGGPTTAARFGPRLAVVNGHLDTSPSPGLPPTSPSYEGEAGLGRHLQALVGECHLADDGVVEGLEAGAVVPDVVRAPAAIEAVGTQESMEQAIHSTRPGGHVGYVGVTHDVELNGMDLFFSGVHLHGGPAPVRRFLPELIDLIDLIMSGEINPGEVFDLTLPLDQAAEGYKAMDERRATKVLLSL